MLAAFIIPNHPEIAKVVIRGSEILQKWTGKPSFVEYQSLNPDRVKKQMSAIYEAIAELNLVYYTVPASFEESSQRVRLCDTIFSKKLANCLNIQEILLFDEVCDREVTPINLSIELTICPILNFLILFISHPVHFFFVFL